MIALIRRNKTIRSLPLLLVKGLLLSTVYLGFYDYVYAVRESGSITTLIVFAWMNLSIYLTLGNIWNRCGQFELALPISTRRLWLAHFIAVFASSMVMLAITCAVLSIGGRLILNLKTEPTIPVATLTGVLPQLLAGVFLSVAILQSRSLSLYRIPKTGLNRFIMAVVIIGGLLLVLALNRMPVWISLFPVLAGLAIMWQSWRRLPPAYLLASSSLAAPDPAESAIPPGGRVKTAADIPAGRTWEYRRVLIKTVLHVTTSVQGFIKVPGAIYPFALLIVAWGMFLSGFFKVLLDWEETLRFTMIILSAYILFAALKGQMSQLHLLDPLPISRKTLFNIIILPFFLLMAAGYGMGIIGTKLMGEMNQAVRYEECCGGHRLYIPYEFWKISWNGEPKTVDAPWGESYQAWQKSLFKSGGPAIFFPYDTPIGCSADFTALQISRAIEDIYQRHIPPDEIKERYLESVGDQVLGPKASGLTLLEDYPGLKRRGDGPLFPIIFLPVGLIWLAMVYIYLSFFKAGVSETRRTAVFIVLMVVSLGLHILQFVLMIARLGNLNAFSGIIMIACRDFSRMVPGGSLIVWAVCLLILAAAYRLTGRRFKRIEIAVKKEPSEI